MNNERINVVMPSLPPYKEYIEEIKSIWDTHILTNQGPKYLQLEASLKEHFNAPNLLIFCNGHVALEIAIEALNLTGEIITTPLTFASTTQAIVRNGIKPVFCDIDPTTYTIDVTKIESLITEKTSAIIPVHVYGNICDVEAIDKIAKKHNLKVIYDAAHVFGVKYKGKDISSFGDMSMFSFHATKVFNTVEGGGLVFKDSSLNDIIKQLRQFGMQDSENVPLVGTNAKLSEMHAAMGICNLRHVDEQISLRKAAVEQYFLRLNNVKGIKLSPTQKNVTPNYAYFPVLFDGYKENRDEIAQKLASNNIYARKYFYPLTSDFDVYQNMFYIEETPTAKHVADNVLCLPLYASLTKEQVDAVCDIILK